MRACAIFACLVALGWFVVSSWSIASDAVRLDRLYAIHAIEVAAIPVPSMWLEHIPWLAFHRLSRLALWRTYVVTAFLIGVVEGWDWRRKQYFRGYHQMLKFLAIGLFLCVLAACAVFVLWLQVIPTTWALPILCVLVLATSFTATAGFPSVQ